MNQKPTKRQKQIVEHFIKTETKRILKEAPESNLENLFVTWVKQTSKSTKLTPGEIFMLIAKYLKRDYSRLLK